MVSRSLTLLFALLFAASASAELQLNPVVSEYEGEGMKFRQLAFSDGSGKRITYSQPAGWEYSGSPNKLTVRPPNKPQAEGSITKLPLPKAAVFDEKTMKQLTAEALAAVPSGSTSVTLMAEEKNPIVIGEKETFLVTMSYNFHGQDFGRSVMFLNRGNEQLRFQFVSRLPDFKDLQRAFQGSHFSWQNL